MLLEHRGGQEAAVRWGRWWTEPESIAYVEDIHEYEDLSGVVRARVARGGWQSVVGTGLDMVLVYVVVVVGCSPFSH